MMRLPLPAAAPGFLFADAIRAGCTGKTRFPNRGAALLATGQRRLHAVKQRGRLQVYRCTGCRGWHLGSTAF